MAAGMAGTGQSLRWDSPHSCCKRRRRVISRYLPVVITRLADSFYPSAVPMQVDIIISEWMGEQSWAGVVTGVTQGGRSGRDPKAFPGR